MTELRLLTAILLLLIMVFGVFATGIWLLNIPSTIAFAFGVMTVAGAFLGAVRALYVIFREKN